MTEDLGIVHQAATVRESASGPWRAVANRCSAGSCPTVYAGSGDTVIVQGFVVSSDRIGINVPAGETLVEIPAELLAEALRNLA